MTRRMSRRGIISTGGVVALAAALVGALVIALIGTPGAGGAQPSQSLALTTPERTSISSAAIGPPTDTEIATQSVGGDILTTRWDPPAIFNDGADTSTFTATISGGTFDSAWVSAGGGILDADTDVPADVALFEVSDDLIRIFDDGTNGDAAAGDGIFTRSGVTASGVLQHDGGSHERVDSSVYFFRSSGAVVNSSVLTVDTGIGVVDAGQRSAAQAQDLGAGLTATTHALFWVDDGTVYPSYPNVDAESAVDLCNACGIIIDQFGDAFDFVILHNREVLNEVPDCGCQAFFKGTKNDVEGIGLDLRDINGGADTFSNGTPFNTFSDGQLRGVIWSNRIDGAPLSHEVMHRWAVHAAPSLVWLDGEGHYTESSTVTGIMDLDLLTGDGSIFDLPAAPGLPVDFVPNGDGTFRLVSRPGEFNATFDPASLYLAGFIPASQVPEISVFDASPDVSDPNVVTVDASHTITANDIIAIEGARSPSSATSPKDFTVGTIVISDRAYTEAEYAFITLALRYWESDKTYDGSGAPPWKAATNGISTITVALPDIVFAGAPDLVIAEVADDEITLDDATAVTLTVLDDVGVPVSGVDVQFAEGLVPALLSASLVTTDAAGQATTLFTGQELGLFEITGTVVDVVNGVPVATALSAAIQVSVVEAPPPPVVRAQVLQPRWNLVGWTGETTGVTDATATIATSLGAFFTWDTSIPGFLTFNPTLPGPLNSLQDVPLGAGVWTFITDATPLEWEQPAFTDARSVPLAQGFNLVMWTGPDGTAVTDAIAGLNGLQGLFIWDAAGQTFLTFNPVLPPALNSATTLDYGFGVWVLMASAGTWDQPGQ